MRYLKNKPVVTALPGDCDAKSYPTVADSTQMVIEGHSKPRLRSHLSLTPAQLEAARQAAARLAETKAEPVLPVAAFQSSI